MTSIAPKTFFVHPSTKSVLSLVEVLRVTYLTIPGFKILNLNLDFNLILLRYHLTSSHSLESFYHLGMMWSVFDEVANYHCFFFFGCF